MIDLNTALAAVTEAKANYLDAEERTQNAKIRERVALRLLDETQKVFDEIVVAARVDAPRDSRWFPPTRGYPIETS